MGLNEFILGLNNLETITRAPGFFKYTEHTQHIRIVSRPLRKFWEILKKQMGSQSIGNCSMKNH